MGVVGAPAPTLVARAFFVLIVGGALVASLVVAGPGWQTGAAGTLLALTLIEITIRRPMPDPPPSQWLVQLTSPVQRLRHTVLLPLGTAEWQRAWSRATTAAIHVCARGPLDASTGPEVYLNDERVARMTEELAYGPGPELTSVRFYRVPVTRAALEGSAKAVIELRLGPPARPVEICGTFTYRPTAGLDSSQFFDGSEWHSPGSSQHGRYAIEVRLEDSNRKPVMALY